MIGTGVYNIVDTTTPTDKDDLLGRKWETCNADGECEDVYLKPAFTDKIKAAELVIVLDAQGYPISYDRNILLELDKYEISLPYFARYTFERQ